MWNTSQTGCRITVLAALLLGWSTADVVPFSAQKSYPLGATGDPYNAGAAASGSESRTSGQYQLHLGPLPSAVAPTLQLEDLVFAIATHTKKKANVFAGRPFRLVRQHAVAIGAASSIMLAVSITQHADKSAGTADVCGHRPQHRWARV